MNIVDAANRSVFESALIHFYLPRASVSPCEEVLPFRAADEALMKDGISRKLRANPIFLKAMG